MTLLPYVEVCTAGCSDQKPADAVVIWLHGLGVDGHDFAPIVKELDLPSDARIRFLFPHAPEIPVTINGGYIMPAWYDILVAGFERQIDRAQLLQSVDNILDLIETQIDLGIPENRIVIAGFSQGGAVAFHIALFEKIKFAGLLALSTYIADKELSDYSVNPNQSLPIMVMHGEQDDVVPMVLAQQSVELIKEIGFDPEFKTYSMNHGVHPEQLREISKWFRKVLP